MCSNCDKIPDPNRLSIERNNICADIVLLKKQIIDLEKQARKTPPKTLKSEWMNVNKAKEELVKAKQKLEKLMLARQELTEKLHSLGYEYVGHNDLF